jgi:hypothetical protein
MICLAIQDEEEEEEEEEVYVSDRKQKTIKLRFCLY